MSGAVSGEVTVIEGSRDGDDTQYLREKYTPVGAGTVSVTPHVNRFPAGTIRYQETELVYIFLKSFGG